MDRGLGRLRYDDAIPRQNQEASHLVRGNRRLRLRLLRRLSSQASPLIVGSSPGYTSYWHFKYLSYRKRSMKGLPNTSGCSQRRNHVTLGNRIPLARRA